MLSRFISLWHQRSVWYGFVLLAALFPVWSQAEAKDAPVSLSSSQAFLLSVCGMAALVIVLCTMVIAWGNKERLLLQLAQHEFLILRILTVLFVVWATTGLALLGGLNEGVTAIFGGIVGYVLGSIRGDRRANTGERQDDDERQAH